MTDETRRDRAIPPLSATAPGSVGPRWALVAGVTAAAALIIAGAVVLIADYRATQYAHAEEVLSTAAATTALEFEGWLSNGYADVEIIATQSGIAERYARWRAGLDPNYPRLLQNRIDAERRIRGYASVVMFASDGAVVSASSEETIGLDAAQIRSLLDRASAEDGPVFEDHFHGTHGDWMVAWAAPVRQSAEAAPIGFMIYTTAMREPARAVIGRDPLPYSTGVMMLARDHEDGSDYLSTENGFASVNERTAGEVHKAIAQGLATSDAVIHSGRSDEGADVLAAGHIVPGTRWMIVSRVNRAEIDAPVYRYGLLVGLAALFLIATVALGGAITWRIRDERYREYQVLLELKEALEVRDRFLASMSHELRTPLQSIMGFTSVMLGGLAGPITEEQQRQLTMVDESSKRLLALVDDVLDIGKIGAGRMPVSISEFTTGEVERVVCGMMRPLIARKSITCTPVVEDPDLTLHTDRDMVERIVLNLVSNAIKFTDEGFVNLTVRPDGPDHVVFEVADSGRGIPADEIERVMEEFHQVIEPGGVKPVGTGLGLAISRRMAEALGGTLSCESEVGTGSRFRLRIPRVYPGAM